MTKKSLTLRKNNLIRPNYCKKQRSSSSLLLTEKKNFQSCKIEVTQTFGQRTNVRIKFHNFKSITKWCTTEEIQADVILVNNGKNCSILCERLKLMNQNKITLNRFPIVPTPNTHFLPFNQFDGLHHLQLLG